MVTASHTAGQWGRGSLLTWDLTKPVEDLGTMRGETEGYRNDVSMWVSLLFRKWPPALSSSTGGHWLEGLNSLGLLITSLRGCIVPQAQRISAANTPVHIHTCTGSQAPAAPHRPTQPLINRPDYQTGRQTGLCSHLPEEKLVPVPQHLANFSFY